jgi:hypothetical protein
MKVTSETVYVLQIKFVNSSEFRKMFHIPITYFPYETFSKIKLYWLVCLVH